MTTRSPQHTEPESEQPAGGVSRRLVTRTAAWATPVVLSAATAPAYAAASGDCADHGQALLDDVGSWPDILLFPPSQRQASIFLELSDSAGRKYTPDGRTGTIETTEYTPEWNYLTMHHEVGMSQGDTIALTLTFDAAVENLTLTVTDIDMYTGRWIDQVYTTSGAIASAKGVNVVGSGTSADPFTSTVKRDIYSDAGDVTLTWPGPLTVVQVFFRAGDASNTSSTGQHIGVGKIGFNSCA